MRTVAVLLLGLVLILPGCIEMPSDDHGHEAEFNGLQYQPPISAPDFTLTDQNGNNVSLSDSDGKVVVVGFTYTHCPDVCLVVEANMNFVKSQLGDDASNVAFISISIDPARDTPEHLLNWTNQMGYDWPHLTSENHMTLMAMWDSWGIAVDNDHINSNHSDHGEANNSSSGDNGTDDDEHDDSSEHGEHGEEAVEEYTVGHSTVTFILDQDGNKRVAWVGSDWSTAEFLEDVETLLDDQTEHSGH